MRYIYKQIYRIYTAPTMSNKKKTSFTLSEQALATLAELADARGLSMASTIETLIREEAKRSKG